MKKLIALTLVSLCAGQIGFAQSALDMSKLPSGNSLNQAEQKILARPDSIQELKEAIIEDEKRDCDADGCVFHVTTCAGSELRLGASIGEGTQYGTSGVNIYTGGDQNSTGVNSNLSLTYIKTNYVNKVKIDRSIYEFIKMNLGAASTKEHVKASIDQRDPSVSKEEELALSAAIAMNGAACQNTQSTYAH